ncbi:MAG: DUF2075 domain-containing protein [Thermomicrobiales bacterium]
MLSQTRSLSESPAAYSATIPVFLRESNQEILGKLSSAASTVDGEQMSAWRREIEILKEELRADPFGRVLLEFPIPRLGRRIDAVVVKQDRVFVIEFKIGSVSYGRDAIRQIEGYALDLCSFHDTSQRTAIMPVLVCTSAPSAEILLAFEDNERFVSGVIRSNGTNLGEILALVSPAELGGEFEIDAWEHGTYHPTPTIIESARALYASHEVTDITQTTATARNLSDTADAIAEVKAESRRSGRKSICFVTGVPGAGKTLAGLNVATKLDEERPEDTDHLAVFLSGNGPLVGVLREALVRDAQSRGGGRRHVIQRSVERFIQNVHHFRDAALSSPAPPIERIAVFDEAQRAWDQHQTSSFMARKRNVTDFAMSESEFLLSYMERIDGWCVVVALIGEGQEIHKGEAGVEAWLEALAIRHETWDVHVPPSLRSAVSTSTTQRALGSERVKFDDRLHLATSLRSFRAGRISDFVARVVAGEADEAYDVASGIEGYPLRITRSVDEAIEWLRARERGIDTVGLLASSGGMRLRPMGIHVKNDLDPPLWFLNPAEDVRSSNALETVGTEFQVQGLELDWTAVIWDANFRHDEERFGHWQFKGTKWQQIRAEGGRRYLENAYRVLLTRARQGMVVVVPEGEERDSTRDPSFYDGTFTFLRACGFEPL